MKCWTTKAPSLRAREQQSKSSREKKMLARTIWQSPKVVGPCQTWVVLLCHAPSQQRGRKLSSTRRWNEVKKSELNPEKARVKKPNDAKPKGAPSFIAVEAVFAYNTEEGAGARSKVAQSRPKEQRAYALLMEVVAGASMQGVLKVHEGAQSTALLTIRN